jgi:hypothetical protein
MSIILRGEEALLGKKVVTATLLSACFVLPGFLASVIAPAEISGSTSGNQFYLVWQAGAITFHGWVLEPILPLSNWSFRFEYLPPLSKTEIGGIAGLFGFDVLPGFTDLGIVLPFWSVTALAFLNCLIVLQTLTANKSRLATASPSPAT